MKQNETAPGSDAGAEREITASAEDEGRRLDLFLADRAGELSRSRVQKLIETGRVLINGLPCTDNNYRLRTGDLVKLSVPPPLDYFVLPEQIALDIIYEDNDLLVINKPRGMVVHPAPGHGGGTLVNALLHHCRNLSGIGGVIRPGIVHRLDKDTSGLLLVAKNDFTHRSLSEQLKTRQLNREYLALVSGRVKPASGSIEAPIARHPRHRKKMAVVAGGRKALTRYRVLKYFGNYSLLKLALETGRTHQIRVHLAHLGHPVVGDPVYASRGWPDLSPALSEPQALHARRIRFFHPRTSKLMEFSAPLPRSFKEGLTWLKAQSAR